MSNQLREQIQTQIVELITAQLEAGTMSEDRARQIAKLILEKLPENISQEQLIQIVPTLDDEFSELRDIVLPIMIDYESKIRKAVEQKVIQLIQQKKFKEALGIAKQGIDYTAKYVRGEIASPSEPETK